jgi:methionyl-tRNA formyltransferase
MDKRIVFMGSPDFAVPALQALAKNWSIVGVVTQPDRPAGRGRKLQPPIVKVLAHELQLPIFQPKMLRETAAIDLIRKLAPDVIVVVAFGQILKQDVLAIPSYGCINVHASLLPRWRGAAPIQAAILHDEITGVTIMQMDEGLDTGPILSQRSVPIQHEMTAGDLSVALAQMGAELLIDTLPLYFDGAIKPRAQVDAEATQAPRLVKADGELDFNRPAEYLTRQIRAFNPWPGSFFYLEGVQIRVFRAQALVQKQAVPGKRYIIDSQPALGTRKGMLVLSEVQAAGKKRMSGREFLRGTHNWIEDQED